MKYTYLKMSRYDSGCVLEFYFMRNGKKVVLLPYHTHKGRPLEWVLRNVRESVWEERVRLTKKSLEQMIKLIHNKDVAYLTKTFLLHSTNEYLRFLVADVHRLRN